MAREADERIAALMERLEQAATGGLGLQSLSGDASVIAGAINKGTLEIALGLARVEKQLETLLGAPALAGD
jgi:hypothetical protein